MSEIVSPQAWGANGQIMGDQRCMICEQPSAMLARCRGCKRWVCWNKQGDCCSYQQGEDKSFWCINCASRRIVRALL